MKIIASFIITILASTLIVSNVYAVKAYPYPIKKTQPDGSTIMVRLHGDENSHYTTTLDGYPLIVNAEGILTYVKINENGQLISTNIKAKDIEKRTVSDHEFVKSLSTDIRMSLASKSKRAVRSISKTSAPRKAYPLTGTPKSLVILVNFSDKNFVTPNPKNSFSNLLNQAGYSSNGGTGSARDYFRDNSMGLFNPQFEVVGPYTISGTMASYGGNDASKQDIGPQQMVIDACAAASANGVNFAQYDTDNDGVVDNIFIYYAGYNEAEGGSEETVWPHRWALNNNLTTKFNGVSVNDYACTSELKGSSGSNMCGIGTFCHEFGHVLGLPDFYAPNDAKHQTLSDWDIMDGGPYLNAGRTPPSYSAYERFFLNWLKPTELLTDGQYKLDTLSKKNTAYLISKMGNHNLIGNNPNPVEFFLLENRQNSDWDSYLPGHGMLLTHVCYNLSTWDANTPNNEPDAMGVDIVEADKIASDQTLSGDPFPGRTNVTFCALTFRDKTVLSKPILNIAEINGIIHFQFDSYITVNQTIKRYSTVQGTPSAIQTFSLKAKKLTEPLSISFKKNQHFEIKKESDSNWGKMITLNPSINGNIDSTVIQIRYNPTAPSYAAIHTETISIKSGTSVSDFLISGVSTRAVFVERPVTTEATDTTFSSFVAHWNSVYDATGYYLTVYSISNGESSLKEGFDNGEKATPGWTISVDTISNSAVYYGDKAPSLQFSSNNNFVQTEKYVLPATSLSFYIRSMAAANGGLLIEVQNTTNNWRKIDSIPIVSNLLEKRKTYTFTGLENYNQFKFTYIKGTGSITFDDLEVKFNKLLTYKLRNKLITSTFDTITSLVQNTEYFYAVRATDKSPNYENITEPSNTISVKTLLYPSKSLLKTKMESNGNLIVYLPTTDYKLNIYNLLGECIQSIVPTNATITIKNLPKNKVYILKSNNLVAKIVF